MFNEHVFEYDLPNFNINRKNIVYMLSMVQENEEKCTISM
jgi:hypothetical protein